MGKAFVIGNYLSCDFLLLSGKKEKTENFLIKSIVLIYKIC